MSALHELHTLTVAKGVAEGKPVQPRPSQLEVAAMMDIHLETASHLAVEAPTGVGKSLLAFAAAGCGNNAGTTIATYSNALMIQLRDDLVEFGGVEGVDWACLAGSKHYWCELQAPYESLPVSAQRAVDEADGCFIGSGMRPNDYVKHSLAALADRDGETSPCTGCEFRPGCSLWLARNRAAEARIVVTNAALLAIALKLRGAETVELEHVDTNEYYADDVDEDVAPPWPVELLRDTIVVDEADSVESLMRGILMPGISITGGRNQMTVEDAALASTTPTAALLVLERYAEDPSHKMHDKAAHFLENLVGQDGNRREPEYEVEELLRQGRTVYKVTLSLPNRLDKWWVGLRVLAMSATLTAQQVRWLGLLPEVPVQTVPGLNVSNVEVVCRQQHPAWSYKEGPARDTWVSATARMVANRVKEGNTLGLFQSRKDLNDVAEVLQAMKVPFLIYLSDQDRPTIIAQFKKEGNQRALLACNAGGGRGLDLPGDLLNHVVISRVAQNPSLSIRSKLSRLRWRAASSADIIQSVGRSCRFDGDHGTVDILGGFGSRIDIRERLEERGWNIQWDNRPDPEEGF